MDRTTHLAVVSFMALAGAASAQEACEPVRLAPPPDVPPTAFGYDLATNGRSWVATDPSARTWCPGGPFHCAAGAVHVYELIDGQLELVQTIVPSDIRAGDGFGNCVAIRGNELLVGLPGKDWTGTEVYGGVYMYRFEAGQWVEVERVPPPPGSTLDDYEGFGGWIDFDDSLAVIRSSGARSSTLAVYERLPDGWAFRQAIEAPDGVPDSACFGEYPALSDGWLMVTAREDSSAGDRAGSVYVYRRHGDDTLEFVQKLYAPEPQERDRFGSSLSHQGDTLVVGAFLADRPHDGEGAVFIYGLEDDRWVLRQEIVLSGADEDDGFGANVHLDGDLLLVRASGRKDALSIGKVFRFHRGADGLWREAGSLEPNPPAWARSYGWAMTSWGGPGGSALIGAHDDVTLPTDQFGAAYFFDLACEGCPTDLDADGRLTVFDLLTFLNLFDDGDARADFDGDGELTVFDLLAFQTAFDAGCE